MKHHISTDSYIKDNDSTRPVHLNLTHFIGQAETLTIVGRNSFDLSLEETLTIIEELEASIRLLTSGQKTSVVLIHQKVAKRLEKVEDLIG